MAVPLEKLREARALTFDCYGTLIDWERGILDVLRPWAERVALDVDDDVLLAAFAEAESATERRTPGALYSEILREVHADVARALGEEPDPDVADALARSVGSWPAFPDTPDALVRLGRRYALVVVSNVDHASFEGTLPRLGVELHELVTAEDAGAYKPDLRMFKLAFERLARTGIDKESIVHVAQSLYHDHVPAQALGLPTVWVDRRRGRAGGATPGAGLPVEPDLVVPDLATLADLLLD